MRRLRIVNSTVSVAITAVTPATCLGEMLATATKKTYMTMAPSPAIHSDRPIRVMSLIGTRG